MLLQENFTEAHIRGFRAESKRDPLLCLMSLTILQRCAQPIERLLRHNARIEEYRSGMRFSSQTHFVQRFASHRIANLCVMNMNAMPMRFVR